MLKKIFFGMSALALFAACNEDFTDWEQPQTNPEVAAQTIEWSVVPVQETSFVLDDLTSETVQLFTVSLPENVTVDGFNVKLTGEETNYPDYNISADKDGFVSVTDLQNATAGMYSLEAVERTFTATISTNAKVAGETGTVVVSTEAAAPITVKVTPLTPEFNQFIYFIGSTDGWSAAEQKLESPSCNGVYTGFCYIADPNVWGTAFKFQNIPGNWDSQINAGSFTKMTGVSGTDNFEVDEEGVYYMEVNLANNSITLTKVTALGIIGDFNGWAGDVEMTWNATDYCYEATNPGITANGWKFRMNNDWAVNFGGSLTDLVQGGDNLSAVGTTVKFYPTRKTSNKIYCTVE